MIVERIDPADIDPVILAEHCHRYRWAAAHARGAVLDAACGVGYGSAMLAQSPQVTRCIGLDRSDEAINIARARFTSDATEFVLGDVMRLPFPPATFDTVVSLETLEHLDSPERAIDAFARVLKPGGVLLLSVPTPLFEDACTETYGPNPHHLSRLGEPEVRRLLAGRFAHIAVLDAWLEIVSIVRARGGADSATLPSEPPPSGCLLAAASNDAAIVARVEAHGVDLARAGSLVAHDRRHVTPCVDAIARQTQMIDERDELLRRQDEIIAERDSRLKDAHSSRQEYTASLDGLRRELSEANRAAQEQSERTKAEIEVIRAAHAATDGLLQDRDAAVAAQARMIDERDTLLRRQDGIIAQRDADLVALQRESVQLRATIARQDAMIADRDAAIASQTRMINDRDEAIRAQTGMIDERDSLIRRLEESVRRIGAREAALHEACHRADAAASQARRELENLRPRLADAEACLHALREERDEARATLRKPIACLRAAARALANGNAHE